MMAKIVEQALENTDAVRVKVISPPPNKSTYNLTTSAKRILFVY